MSDQKNPQSFVPPPYSPTPQVPMGAQSSPPGLYQQPLPGATMMQSTGGVVMMQSPGYAYANYPPYQPMASVVAAPGMSVVMGSAYPQPYPVAAPVVIGPPPTAVFDSTARFDGIAQPRIPPPPPGVMPTAAQMASSQGYVVPATQRRGDFWGGGTTTGYVWF